MMIEYKPKSLADQVYERLEESILSGAYEKGRIITEKQLAAELGVSRTPIREALSRLAFDRLVKETSMGSEVRGVTIDDVKDLYGIKYSLEGEVAKRAAKNISEEELKALKDVLDQQVFYAEKGDTEKVRNLDTEFHDIIYKASGSITYETILSGVHHKLKKYRRNSLKGKNRIKESVEEHQAIYKAIEEGKEKAAEKLMVTHIGNAFKSVEKSEKE